MSTNSTTTAIELFDIEAIKALKSIDAARVKKDIMLMYDSAFVYGVPEISEHYNNWDHNRRESICLICKQAIWIAELSTRYDFAANTELKESDRTALNNMFDDERIFNNNYFFQLLEDVMMAHVHFKSKTIGDAQTDTVTSVYNTYRLIKQVLAGYLHKGEYACGFKMAS